MQQRTALLLLLLPLLLLRLLHAWPHLPRGTHHPPLHHCARCLHPTHDCMTALEPTATPFALRSLPTATASSGRRAKSCRVRAGLQAAMHLAVAACQPRTHVCCVFILCRLLTCFHGCGVFLLRALIVYLSGLVGAVRLLRVGPRYSGAYEGYISPKDWDRRLVKLSLRFEDAASIRRPPAANISAVSWLWL
jgi:hypothetical protein